MPTPLGSLKLTDAVLLEGEGSGLTDTDDLAEGATNLYYTDARARAAISVTPSLGLTYNSGTGVLTLAQDLRTSASPTFAGETLTGGLTLGGNLTVSGSSAWRLLRSATGLPVTATLQIGPAANGSSDTDGGPALWLTPDTGAAAATNGQIDLIAYGRGTNADANAIKLWTRSGAGAITERLRVWSGGGVSIGTMTDPGAGGLLVGGGARLGAALLASTDASYDIGASGATRFRDLYQSRDGYFGGGLNVGSATGAAAGEVKASGGFRGPLSAGSALFHADAGADSDTTITGGGEITPFGTGNTFSGFFVLIDTFTGVGSIWLEAGNAITKIGGDAGHVNSSTPTSTQIGVYWSSYVRIKNGYAASHGVRVMAFRARAA